MSHFIWLHYAVPFRSGKESGHITSILIGKLPENNTLTQ